jgi:ABC-2 type transport system ATP-binding protein
MNILELQDLKKYFATQKAVDGISFNIEKGSIFGLLGPNGAGKTTLIRMITGIFYQDSGQILFNGHPFKPERDITSIGYMPEERGLYKKMKIGEQAMYLAQLKGLSRTAATEAVKEWFVKFEMESWWNKKVEDLSKGMSQKLQFVTTVLHRPELIILDEPFSGLDPVNASLIKDEIFNLAKSGSTIIFSTHRMEQVEEICDQIVLINRGKKILDGKVDRIKQDFKENLFSIETEQGDITEDTSLFRIIEKRKDRIRIRLEEGVSTNKVLGYFIDKNVTIRNFNEVLPSLDEIFIKLVEHSGATRSFQKIND